MTFLAALAGMARGEPPAGAARPVLPPRFGRALSIADAVSVAGSMPAAGPQRTAPVSARTVPGTTPGPDHAEPAAQPLRPTPAPLSTAHASSSESETARAASTPIAPPPAFVGHASLPPTSDAHHAARAVLPAEASPATQSVPPRSPTPIGRAPLGQNVIAERVAVAREPREQRPVIHVAIDRIDVRAPATPASPAAAPRARQRPTRSLADYLASGRDGARE